jgi:hypothetical protein
LSNLGPLVKPLYEADANHVKFVCGVPRMNSKVVFSGEWVKVANLRNKHFAAKSPCSICRKLTAGRVWYSIKSKEVRCRKCFHPWEDTDQGEIVEPGASPWAGRILLTPYADML